MALQVRRYPVTHPFTTPCIHTHTHTLSCTFILPVATALVTNSNIKELIFIRMVSVNVPLDRLVLFGSIFCSGIEFFQDYSNWFIKLTELDLMVHQESFSV